MMEQGLGLVSSLNGPHSARDFSRPNIPGINNNEFKDSTAATIMSHLLKVRQEMALNMSKDSDSDRQTESPGRGSRNSDIDHQPEEEDKDEPMNLQQNGRSSAGTGSGSDGETSPASPSSDAGLSTSSAKDQKTSRLENIVGGLSRSTSSPLPPAGCKKRKLYQPMQHDGQLPASLPQEGSEEPEAKKKKEGIEIQLRTMQDQLARMQQRFINHNDENADPEEKDGELQIDLSCEDKKPVYHQKDEVTIERKSNPRPFINHPLLNGAAEPLPIPPSTGMSSNYMDLAKKFIQEQQDKVTKDMITKDIIYNTIGKQDIADKLAAISPELEGLADILKNEITISLTIIIDSIVQRFLSARRQPLTDSFNAREKASSGRAPQVRDRATPRTISNSTAPLSMSSPLSLSNAINTNKNIAMTNSPLPPRSGYAPTSLCGDMPMSFSEKASPGSLYPMPNNNGMTNGQHSEDDREEDSEQDDALNLVVTPKKKRHKVTDTRITPRTVSRLLGDQPLSSMTELHKHFGPTSPFCPPGFPMPKNLDHFPRPPFHGIPPSLIPSLPNSLASITNPSLNEFPLGPFGFPMSRARDLSPPPKEHRPRSVSPPADHRPPPPLLHPAILAAQSRGSPDFSFKSEFEHRPPSDNNSDDYRFDTPTNTPFSLANMSGGYSMSDNKNSTLTPMHLRKAKLMFFWVRYPSSAILKMYFPDIMFNKNNTAQLVKWFSNFREFFYIQMEKYARQTLSEGIKNCEEIRVSIDSELYRVINLHYNRNNHIEVPDHFCPVVEATLREFFNAIQMGRDSEPSWKKQIYKIIARYDEPIPDYFKTEDFLRQLE